MPGKLNANPFALTPAEVESLSNDEFVALANQLIHNRALVRQISIDQVRTTLRTNDPDGGVDAIVDTGYLSDEFLGQGLSVWQFKKSFPSESTKNGGKSDLEEEFDKQGVIDTLALGGGYTLVVGKQRTPGGQYGQTKKQERLATIAQNANCTGSVRLLVADHVATWTNQDPGALFSIRPQIRGLVSAKSELESPRHVASFEPDPDRLRYLEEIGERLFSTTATTTHIRIQGQAGVGKSRLALEAARQFGSSEGAFYAAGAVTTELFDWVSVQPQAHMTLIIDECETEDARRYAEMARRANGRIKLITVGPGETRGLDIFLLHPIAADFVERIITAETNLPPERARWIANKTRGFVKLAMLVAKAVERGSTNLSELSSDFDISDLVQKLLSPDEGKRRALRGVALLSRVGVEGDVEAEGRMIAEFMAMEWTAFRHALLLARRQNIVVKRGRYFYVSPELLAIWLAGEVWSGQADRILEFQAALPGQASRMAFHERLASLRDIPEVEEVVVVLLGPAGPFRSLGDLTDNLAGRLYATLAKGHPQAALSSLTRIIGDATLEELQSFRAGRQEIVWTLRTLLERRSTFFQAIRLLRRLAEAENETYYSNNATDYWNKSFLTVLGQTEVPALDRLPLIDEALASPTESVRLLGVSALSTVLLSDEWASAETSDEAVPPEYWKPRTYDEVRAVKSAGLGRLIPLLSDDAPTIAGRAREALRTNVRGLVDLGLTDEIIAAYAGLTVHDGNERRTTWQSIRSILKFERRRLTDDQRGRLEEIAKGYFDDSLRDRLKRYLGSGSFDNWDEDDLNLHRTDAVLAGLADEADSNPEWLELVPWLFSGDAHNLYPFVRRLGEIDSQRKWFEPLSQAAVGSIDPRGISAYLDGYGSVSPEREAWVNQVLDEWADDPTRAAVVWDATLRGKPSEFALNRLLALVNRGLLPASFLGWLRTGEWIESLSIETVAEVIGRLVADGTPDAISSGLSIITTCQRKFSESSLKVLEASIWKLLESPAGWSSGPNTDYLWHSVATPLVAHAPLRVVDILTRIYCESEPPFMDERLALLNDAAKIDLGGTLERLAPALLDSPIRFRLHWALRDSGFFLEIGQSSDERSIEEWITKHGAEAAKAVAASIKIPESSLPPLVRFLLTNYENDIAGPLTGGFLSGGWTGSEALYLEPKLKAAREWAQDESTSVRKWASTLRDDLEMSIDRARLREVEEFFR